MSRRELLPAASCHSPPFPITACHSPPFPIAACHSPPFPIAACHSPLFPIAACHSPLFPIIACHCRSPLTVRIDAATIRTHPVTVRIFKASEKMSVPAITLTTGSSMFSMEEVDAPRARIP